MVTLSFSKRTSGEGAEADWREVQFLHKDDKACIKQGQYRPLSYHHDRRWHILVPRRYHLGKRKKEHAIQIVAFETESNLSNIVLTCMLFEFSPRPMIQSGLIFFPVEIESVLLSELLSSAIARAWYLINFEKLILRIAQHGKHHSSIATCNSPADRPRSE